MKRCCPMAVRRAELRTLAIRSLLFSTASVFWYCLLPDQGFTDAVCQAVYWSASRAGMFSTLLVKYLKAIESVARVYLDIVDVFSILLFVYSLDVVPLVAVRLIVELWACLYYCPLDVASAEYFAYAVQCLRAGDGNHLFYVLPVVRLIREGGFHFATVGRCRVASALLAFALSQSYSLAAGWSCQALTPE